jgi:16S rRNA (guanine527-N7)-methyltransferase
MAAHDVTLISQEGLDLAVERERLTLLAAAVDIELTHEQADALLHYLDLVLEKNKVLNLTAIREWPKALVLHLVDSLIILPEFDGLPRGPQEKPFLDMGCGAGFPGIPLAVMRPHRTGLLCDSVKKKITAVDEFIDALNLNGQLSTSTERLEVLGTNHRRAFGTVTARALGSLPVLVEYAAPLLAKGGQLVVTKGQPEAAELEQGFEAAELCGLELLSQRSLELPEGFGTRTILAFGKTGEPLIDLPRPIGAATKQPLSMHNNKPPTKRPTPKKGGPRRKP